MGSNLTVIKEKPYFIMNYEFHGTFLEDSDNGLLLRGTYLPTEIIIQILSHIPPERILKICLVCKKWCNIIKSHEYWFPVYVNRYNKKPKKLPWFVYYALLAKKYLNHNILQNTDGKKKFKFWKQSLEHNGFKIEASPEGSDPFPIDNPEFRDIHGCFVTTYYSNMKNQHIKLPKLVKYIIYHFKPHIYASEWIAGRFDCGGTYNLKLKLHGRQVKPIDLPVMENNSEEPEECVLTFKQEDVSYSAGERCKWQKVEILITEYVEGVEEIIFEHGGKDNQFWAGWYGPKMTASNLKILFDSIKENPDFLRTDSINLETL